MAIQKSLRKGLSPKKPVRLAALGAILSILLNVSIANGQGTIGVPDVSGHQLLFFFDARADRVSFLTVANPSDVPVALDVAFYDRGLSSVLAAEVVELGPAGNTIIDPRTFGGGGADGSAGLAVLTPVRGGGDPQPIVPPELLTGGFTLANVTLEAGFGQNPFGRLAVDAAGAPQAPGTIIDGTAVFYERIAPDVLMVPVYFDPTTLSPPENDGNRVFLSSFEDSYSEAGFAITPRSVSLDTSFFGRDGSLIVRHPEFPQVSGVLLTNLQELANGPDPIEIGLDTSGKVFFEVDSTDGNVFGLFSQSLGTYAAGQRLPAVSAVPPPTTFQDVTLRFDARVNGEPFACGQSYPNIGTTNATIEPTDCRLYVQNVRLVTDAGRQVEVSLEQDGVWQFEDVALLDFEDGTGLCQDGTAETNTTVRGRVATASYTGLRFEVGVPEVLNHGDAATAPSPLNKTALFWSWNDGYKFIRYDNLIDETDKGYPIHIGSTLCAGDGRGEATCDNGNRIQVDLAFDPAQDDVIIDLSSFFVGINVEQDGGAAGCMSGVTDPDCAGIFARAGLPFDGNPGGSQEIFLVD